MKRIFSLTLALLSAPLVAAEPKVNFNYEIRPIISSKCFHCHGPDEKSREAKLRLDLREEALEEHESGRTIVPGDVNTSEFVKRITTADRDEVMPPPKEKHALSQAEIALLKKWIEQGAEYQEHWAFVKPVRPAAVAVADLQLPNWKSGADGYGDWSVNPIDGFVLQKLASAKLMPSREAPPELLIRRLTLDLTGLPPTLKEIDGFAQAWKSNRESAVGTTVDRLLASPAFGERWAKMWLDLARYADSTGYGSDFFRLNIWPYRDWVINAFNRNLPYDQFTIEQLAGDLLPNATPEQIAATGFHRNTMTNVEGGTIDEEYRVAAVKDRVATTGQVWMGLTVGCAQCHSHKFDPIPQKDYYRFYGVFNQTEDSDRSDEAPTMPLPTPAEIEKMDGFKKEIAALETKMKGRSPELDAEQRVWEAQVMKPADWKTLSPFEIKAASGATLAAQADGSYLAIGNEPPDADTYTFKVQADLRGITAFRVEALPDDSLPAHGPGRAENGNAVLSDLHVTAGPLEAKPVRGRFVRVTKPDAPQGLALAEVQVLSRGENIALKGTAAQSEVDFGGDAKRANDGKTEGDFAKKSVSHTKPGKDAWWEVDLREDADIESVTVWNRTDGKLESRLANFRVSVLDAAHQPVWEQTVAEPPKPSVALNTSGVKTVALRNPSADFGQEGFSVAMAIDADKKNGWAWAQQPGQAHAAVFETAPLDAAGQVLTFTLAQGYGQRHTLGRFRLSATTQKPAPRELSPEIKAILAVSAGKRTTQQADALTAYFRPLSRTFAELGKEAEAKRAALAAIKPVAVPVMRELPADKQRETHLLTKGNYLTPAEKLEPGLLSAFASFIPPEAKMDRLTAARWLVDPHNPLTARVAVNRFWSQFFGVGIVETEEDFGSQGALPSHPELLDWLAVTFMSPKPTTGSTGVPPVVSGVPPETASVAGRPLANPRDTTSGAPGGTPAATGGTPVLPSNGAELALGWDMKALMKLIVTSATYRQASKVTPEILEKDARNRLLSHAARRRLDAEAVRDQALALAGLLSPKIGGPSVYPPQPDGLWKVAFNGGQNAYPTSKGEDRYRRGIYTFWRRTMPYPSMVTFDAPSRESCTVRRLPTNTPLQAFVTLNDPVFVEAAQALGRRIVREGGADTEAKMRYALRLCVGRAPTDDQVRTLVALYESELATYRADGAAAAKLATEPLGALPAGADAADAAAWTVVANVLLNLDGVLTKN